MRSPEMEGAFLILWHSSSMVMTQCENPYAGIHVGEGG
jgi:hypothetical protein